ncbi:sigma-70 family RNA polymerase sigma factor [Oceanimonas smirnovii]|uniref:sigma-70 family RNA polymerase sigma factor n=1 Tax=Oceanimonas smirnovii TaxID=264574 RepID=UPI003FD61D72
MAISSGASAGLNEQLRLQMLKFATLQLRDPTLAEDAVQEAMLGAFRYADSFNGKAAYKTWVFAILKHKIADELRKRQQLTTVSELDNEGDQQFEEKLFNQNGRWHKQERPQRWSSPDDSLENERFWQIFEACLDGLPASQGRVFMMREFVGLESPEICAELALTVSNLNVLLYRARLRLRACLENRWQQQGDCAC